MLWLDTATGSCEGEPWMETRWLPVPLVVWITTLALTLDARQQARFVRLCTGLLFARGRRTVTSWLRACAVGRDFKRYYYLLGSVGRKAPALAAALLRILTTRLPGAGPGGPLVFAIDDSPTKRYGPHVEGAGVHHNPTPGPAGAKFLYGHVWVTLAWLLRHPRWGAIGLPLRALLYVRRQDVGKLPRGYRVKFQTKLQQAAALVAWAAAWLKYLGKALWVVADGAYAKRPFLKAARAAKVVVVSRLRKDSALWDVPGPPRKGAPKRRGRPRTYGRRRLSLAKRAAQPRGWQTIEVVQYGRKVVKTYKTFLATYRPAGGLIRVVLVKEARGWVAFFCTDPEAGVAAILEAAADRAAVEQDFKDVKEVHGV